MRMRSKDRQMGSAAFFCFPVYAASSERERETVCSLISVGPRQLIKEGTTMCKVH